MSAKIGILGARGYAGRELAGLLARRGDMTLAYVGSRADVGAPAQTLFPDAPTDLRVAPAEPDSITMAGLDAVVLALPNGIAASYASALDAAAPQTVIVDLSADFRADPGWVYGLPELRRTAIVGARRIANPGCYATAAQLALAPLAELIDGTASVFGVSGYSGAGSSPSPRNDPERLEHSVMPYALRAHNHEAEIARGAGVDVHFSPHVFGAFRGLLVTVQAPIGEDIAAEDIAARYAQMYQNEPLMRLRAEAPELRDGRGHDGAVLGGVTLGAGRLAVVCALDNLAKGAASQALQNLALALGLPEFDGLTPPPQ